MRELSLGARAAGRSVGFVPTMGALHEGHLSLVRRARAESDFVVVSIFVNPKQFGAGEDFEKYPRRRKRDLKLCAEEGVDAVFAPAVEDMYPGEGGTTFVEPGPVSQRLEGMSRPGHFRGVCTVVAKLFNVVLPHRAYFGQKDAQQAAVLQRMVDDLNFGTEMVVCPTVREADGLAMSSRNAYLKPKEREAALSLRRALLAAREMVAAGETSATHVAAAMAEEIVVEPLCDLDYAAVVDPASFEDIATLNRPALAALAVLVGRARLIDNEMLRPPGGAQDGAGGGARPERRTGERSRPRRARRPGRTGGK
ncbi:MAG: pantoate--beta-alanine ligase [Planctomycetota bacterium]